MANKKHLRKFGVNESLTARVADVGIIILHSSTGWEIVGCVFSKGVSSIQIAINAHVSQDTPGSGYLFSCLITGLHWYKIGHEKRINKVLHPCVDTLLL